MLSVIIPTFNAERVLTRTLAPLVAGVADGLVKEAILADAGSTDATLDMADAAGCTVVRASAGTQWRAGAAKARGAWLMVLTADVMLDAGWIEETRRFIERAGERAGVFTFALDDDSGEARRTEAVARIEAALSGAARPEQGLLISRTLYDSLGGFDESARAYNALIAKLGRSRVVRMRTRAMKQQPR